jgi:EsV-1-7 cysteine-rich motif
MAVYCVYPNCTTQPNFNKPGEKIGEYCKTHKLPGMVDVKSKRCIYPECTTQPNFNKPGEKVGEYCGKHKLPGMIDVKNKRCIHPNCTIIKPVFNKPGEKSGEYCGKHKLPEMVDVVSKRCIYPECTIIGPVFNKPSEKTGEYCDKHKLTGMLNIVSKRCIHPDCTIIGPLFNKPGEKSGEYCGEHKLVGMIDVTHKLCKTPDCYTRSLDKLNYCPDCFRHLFPFHKRWKNIKQKEVYITKDVAKHLPDLNLIFDKKIDCQSCNTRRPDTFLDLAHYSIILEIDEHQHRGYSCENKRTMELFQSLGNRPIVFIRFNPDRFNNQKGIFKFSKSGLISPTKNYQERFDKLIETFKYHLENKPTKEVTIVHLFYD